MILRSLPAVVCVTATLAVWVSGAGFVAAQSASTFQGSANNAATPTEAIPLSPEAAEVLKLTRAKINDDVTVAFIQTGNRRFNLTGDEVVYLRKEGVSERVLISMLSQPRPGAALQTAPQPAAPASQAAPSVAPEVANPSAPPAITMEAPAPSSSVYVVPSSPTYYSFYDPWPYWYNPWPYSYTSWPYWYPYFTFGFYWGDCHYHDDYHDYHGGSHAYKQSPPPANGQPPPPNGNPPPPNGGSVASRQPGTPATDGTRSTAVNRTPSTGTLAGNVATTPSTRPTSFWSNNGNQPGASAAGSIQPKANVSRTGQSTSPTSIWGSSANTRSVAPRPNGSQAVAPVARNNPTPVSRTGWSSPVSPQSKTYSGGNHNIARASRPSPASSGQAAVWSRPSSPPASRFAGSTGASLSRSSVSPSYSGSAGRSAGMSVPSRSSSMGSMATTGGSRSGGSFSGASRMSSGGGFRGGGAFGGGRR